LSELLYVADNLAYFPFVNQDEPLFLIHHIDVFISVTGSNLLQSFKEMTRSPRSDQSKDTPTETLSKVPQPTEQQEELTEPKQEQILDEAVCQVPVMFDAAAAGSSMPPAVPTLQLSGRLPVQPAAQLPVDAAAGEVKPAVKEEAVDFEEDEDDDEESIYNRLPEDTTVLQECINASQGCLLLLVLKQHLKEMYGLSDLKIHHYSPSEPAKVYEKALTKRLLVHFTPKATIELLKKGTQTRTLDEEGRRKLVQQYLEFKDLMLSIDKGEDDDDEDLKQLRAAKLAAAQAAVAAQQAVRVEGGSEGDGDSLQILHLTEDKNRDVSIHVSRQKYNAAPSSKVRSKSRTPKKEKPKKKAKRKRRRFVSSGEDSSAESDPDFTG